jgi:hypothetical protein
MDITHSCFGHETTPCHVQLFKQAIWHDFNDHSHLIPYDYKSSCKCNRILKNPISVHGID